MLRPCTLLLALVLIISQTAASRITKESASAGVALSDDDAQRLLRAIGEFMQLTSGERDRQVADGNSPDRSVSKRCTGLSTCVLGKLSQDIHKLQAFPRTDVGAGTPGKKRSLSERSETQEHS
ncbi:calcitonin/calcitonin-related polypeptide, alpha [Brachionichthys hirsutus]|uniref:calcitonin/calcitonin-related polypeptide, alpha n=1 Tax=Brachionichthys hirsutus TaxID=412623 RepID=UPI0036052492